MRFGRMQKERDKEANEYHSFYRYYGKEKQSSLVTLERLLFDLKKRAEDYSWQRNRWIASSKRITACPSWGV